MVEHRGNGDRATWANEARQKQSQSDSINEPNWPGICKLCVDYGLLFAGNSAAEANTFMVSVA